jgi:hypothetical protein
VRGLTAPPPGRASCCPHRLGLRAGGAQQAADSLPHLSRCWLLESRVPHRRGEGERRSFRQRQQQQALCQITHCTAGRGGCSPAPPQSRSAMAVSTASTSDSGSSLRPGLGQGDAAAVSYSCTRTCCWQTRGRLLPMGTAPCRPPPQVGAAAPHLPLPSSSLAG